MACGLPVIVTPHTGVNDYVEDGVNGYVVPIRDPEAIFQRLLTLATQPELRVAMGQAAEEVRSAATHTTSSSEEEGFAKAVEDYVLNPFDSA